MLVKGLFVPYRVDTPVDDDARTNNSQGQAYPANYQPTQQISAQQTTAQQQVVIDDAQLRKMRNQQRPSLWKRNKFRIVTLVLIAINVVVYAIEVVLSGFDFEINVYVLVDMGAMYAPWVESAADLYRFVAPMFLHMDLLHLAFNMVALYSVGEVLERTLGKGNYIALYFIGGITGNAVSYVVDMLTGSYAVSAGASTSVFALFVAVALLGVLHKGNRHLYAQYSRSMLVIIVINIVYSLVVPGISIAGHLGGAVGGLFAMFMLPAKNLRVPTVVRILVAILWVVAMVAMLGSLVFGTAAILPIQAYA